MRTEYFSKMVIWPLVSINSVASCEYAREEGKWYLADINLHEDSQSEYLCDLADVEDRNLVNQRILIFFG